MTDARLTRANSAPAAARASRGSSFKPAPYETSQLSKTRFRVRSAA